MFFGFLFFCFGGSMDKKVAIVTGASRGIGAGIVKKLAENNYSVVLNYNNSFEDAKKLQESYSNVDIFKADVSVAANVKALVNYTLEKYGKIDLLVNNAGIDFWGTINDISIDQFDKITKTNLYSYFYTCKFVSENMIQNKSGSIINISSIYGSTGASCEIAYSMSKAGINGLTKSLAYELAPSNIRVNAIAPGVIDTSMNSFLSDDERKNLLDEIPIGRIGSPSDVADCVLYLENCKYITGEILNVTGGWRPSF